MTRWLLRRRTTEHASIDASDLRLVHSVDRTAKQLAQTRLIADGMPLELGELFDVRCERDAGDEIVVEGDLRCVHGLAARHDQGGFTILGNAGNYVAASMSGGAVRVEGSVGDFLAAPAGCEKIGLTGGQIHVSGNTGGYLAHRMRRGTVFIGGNVGPMAAASMVAGTLAIAGSVAENLGVGMKRGTILLADPGALLNGGEPSDSDAAGRFSRPLPFASDFLRLDKGTLHQSFLECWTGNEVRRVRGDRAIGGIGEILFPAGC